MGNKVKKETLRQNLLFMVFCALGEMKGMEKMNEKEFLTKMEEIMDLDENTLTMDSLLEDIDEWDSLSVLSLTVYTKKTLGINLETSAIASFRTINDIYSKCFGEN